MRWMTRDEILEFLGISKRTLQRRVADRGILIEKRNGIFCYKVREEDAPPQDVAWLDVAEELHPGDYHYDIENDMYITSMHAKETPLIIPGDVHRALIASYSNFDGQPDSIKKLCVRFGFPRKWFMEYKRIHGIVHDGDPVTREELSLEDHQVLVDQVYERAQVSFHKKLSEKKRNEDAIDADKWRRFDAVVLTEMERLFQDREGLEPLVLLEDYRKLDSDTVLVIPPMDLHFGMYASRNANGDACWNRDKAREHLALSVTDLLNRLAFKPSKIITTIGSDWFHTDASKSTTTKGTPLDSDGIPAEIFVEGCELMVSFIETLRQVAPVECIVVPGNHDRHNSISLWMYLKAWYRDVRDVAVCPTCRSRQYTRVGRTLLGFSHGDLIKKGHYGHMMAVEAPQDWGECLHRIWLTGHKHGFEVYPDGGTQVFQVPVLIPADLWHYDNGYVGRPKQMMALLVTGNDGVIDVMLSRRVVE